MKLSNNKSKRKSKDILKYDREWFIGWLIIFIVILVANLIAIISPIDSEMYLTINGAVLIINAMIFVFMLGITKLYSEIKQNFTDIIKSNNKMEIGDWGYFLMIICFMFAIISFLFILDIEILKGKDSFRIGTVVVLSVISIIRSLYFGKK